MHLFDVPEPAEMFHAIHRHRQFIALPSGRDIPEIPLQLILKTGLIDMACRADQHPARSIVRPPEIHDLLPGKCPHRPFFPGNDIAQRVIFPYLFLQLLMHHILAGIVVHADLVNNHLFFRSQLLLPEKQTLSAYR